MGRSKELRTFGFICMVALLVVVVLHRLSCYKAQVDGFLQVLSAHTKYDSKRHAWKSELKEEKERQREREPEFLS